MVGADSVADRDRSIRLAFYASRRPTPGAGDHGWGSLQPSLNQMSSRVSGDGMASLITDEMVDAYAVVAAVRRRSGKGSQREPAVW